MVNIQVIVWNNIEVINRFLSTCEKQKRIRFLFIIVYNCGGILYKLEPHACSEKGKSLNYSPRLHSQIIRCYSEI